MKKLISILMLAGAIVSASAANAVPIVFNVHLDGLSEAPPNASPAVGDALITFDADAHTLAVETNFNGLLGTTTAAHIHCCTPAPFTGTAGVASQVPFFEGFPLGVNSGSYKKVFDTTQASTFNPGFITTHGGIPQAELALLAGSLAGNSYFNIHTDKFPGGEIRGFLVKVPEPGGWMLLGFGLLALGLGRRMQV